MALGLDSGAVNAFWEKALPASKSRVGRMSVAFFIMNPLEFGVFKIQKDARKRFGSK